MNNINVIIMDNNLKTKPGIKICTHINVVLAGLCLVSGQFVVGFFGLFFFGGGVFLGFFVFFLFFLSICVILI